MKKYLIKGALALFSGGLLFSCAEKESEYVPLAQQKVKAFEDVFKEVYGDNIDPYQDWGFSQGKVNIDELEIVDAIDVRGDVAYTRATAFGGLRAFRSGTRTANAEKNLWGDPMEYNMKIPPALTQAQKMRVKAYFQHHPYITYEAPARGDYFIQQVYKGYNDPDPDLRPNNDCSLEYYFAADHTEQKPDTVIGSGHMDKLTIGNDEQHVYNFNYGTFDHGLYQQVLNEGESSHEYLGTYTENPGKTHPDQITLMQDINPTCVGFHDSQGQVQHNDHAALVSAAEIDRWATENEAYLRSIGEFGENCVTEGWDRSFVGLDYESKVPEDIYIKNNGQKVYAKVSDCCPEKAFVWDGTRIWKWDDIKDQLLRTTDGRTFPLVMTDKNQYLGTYVKVDQNDMYSMVSAGQIFDDTDVTNLYGDTNRNRQEQVVDLTKIFDAIGSGEVAAVNNDKGGFVKNLGGRDYVYSDWIVTLTKASTNPPPYMEPYITNEDTWMAFDRGRVFCEDLGRAAREDLDYNDIVFDAISFRHFRHYRVDTVYYKDQSKTEVLRHVSHTYIEPTTNYYLNIKLLAAGGTIPVSLYVGEQEFVIHDQFNDPESTPTDMMVNTRDNNSTAYGSFGTREPVELGNISKTIRIDDQDIDFKLIQMPDSLSARISSIRLWSCFGGGTDVHELESTKGGAPQKFMAPYGTTKWASERNNISLAYPGKKDANGNIIEPGFNDWVQNRDNKPWDYADEDYCYLEEHPYDPKGRHLPLAFRCTTTIPTEGEQQLWPATAAKGNESFGPSWNLANIDLTLLDVQHFKAGDRLRIYAENIPTPTNGEEFTSEEQKAWITVVIGNITPYFINTEFPYFVYENGVKVFKNSGCLEVVIDQAAADLINNYIDQYGNLKLEVQGRNFTLNYINRVVN